MSWVSIVDTVRAIEFALETESLQGPVNITAPQPVTNIDFAETVGIVMDKPSVMQVPAPMAYMAFGTEMTDEILLASTRALPEKLSSAGFQFKHTNLRATLHDLIHNRL